MEDISKKLTISILNKKQLESVVEICIEKNLSFQRIYLNHHILSEVDSEEFKKILESSKSYFEEVFITLPQILRERDRNSFDKLYQMICSLNIDGVRINSLEEFAYFENREDELSKVLGANLYLWNHYSNHILLKHMDTVCLPEELTKTELYHLTGFENVSKELMIYGKIPMMTTANCIKNTYNKCNHLTGFEEELKDRKRVTFPVLTDCDYCYNIIYNSVPNSLHNKWKEVNILNADYYFISFTNESIEEMHNILLFYCSLQQTFPIKEYTTGHWNRETL